MTIRYFIFLFLLSYMNVYAQSVTVDFSNVEVGPPEIPGYSGTITVDSQHKIHLYCSEMENGVVVGSACKFSNAGLVLYETTWAPPRNNAALLLFEPPAMSIKGNISGALGLPVINKDNKLGVFLDSNPILLKEDIPASFSYSFERSVSSELYFLSLTSYFPSLGGAAIGDSSAFSVIELNTLSWSTSGSDNLDISLGEITITPSKTEDDEEISVAPDTPLQIDIPVTGVGLEPVESRIVPVMLVVGSTIYQQDFPLSGLNSSIGTVSFNVSIPLEEVTDQTIYAFIDPYNSLNEKERLNNISKRLVHVLCNVGDKGTEVPWFYQSQNPWGEEIYANQDPKKMKALGCMVTSLSMLLNSYGVKIDSHGEALDPGSLNQGLKETLFPELGPSYSIYNGYSADGDVQPNGVVAYARGIYFNECIKNSGNIDNCLILSKRSISYKGSEDSFTENTRKKINKELCLGNPVILKVPSITQPNNLDKAHFVLATGMSVDGNGEVQYIVNDPGSNLGRQLKKNASSPFIRGYRLYRPTDDPSMIFFHLSGDVLMLVTDPIGRRSGYDPSSKQTYDEIPGGKYFAPESIGSSDFDNPEASTDLASRFEGLDPLSGQYKVQIYASSNTSYLLTQYSYDTTGTINGINEKKGNLSANSSVVLELNHLEQALPIKMARLDIMKALFFDKKYKDKAFVSGKIVTSDTEPVHGIEKYIQIKLGSIFISIDKNQLRKIKLHHNGTETYFYHGKKGEEYFSFYFTPQTKEFYLYLSNKTLDNGETNLTVDMMVQIDDLIAKGQVNFKNIRKLKKHGK